MIKNDDLLPEEPYRSVKFEVANNADGSMNVSKIIDEKDGIATNILDRDIKLSSDGQGYAQISFDPHTHTGTTSTGGNGVIEGKTLDEPILAISNGKTKLKARNNTYYANLMIRHRDREHFSVIVGKQKEMNRDNSPHFGFLASGSSLFIVKTHILTANFSSSGTLSLLNNKIIPSVVMFKIEKPNMTIKVKLSYDKNTNTLYAKELQMK